MLRANNACSQAIADSSTQSEDRHSSSVPLTGYERDAGESEAKSHQDKIRPRAIRDHNHANPEFVWGDEGPVNERRETW
jgi:hypothetical protein